MLTVYHYSNGAYTIQYKLQLVGNVSVTEHETVYCVKGIWDNLFTSNLDVKESCTVHKLTGFIS